MDAAELGRMWYGASSRIYSRLSEQNGSYNWSEPGKTIKVYYPQIKYIIVYGYCYGLTYSHHISSFLHLLHWSTPLMRRAGHKWHGLRATSSCTNKYGHDRSTYTYMHCRIQCARIWRARLAGHIYTNIYGQLWPCDESENENENSRVGD